MYECCNPEDHTLVPKERLVWAIRNTPILEPVLDENELPPGIHAAPVYRHEGSNVRRKAFRNRQGLKIMCYAWEVEEVKAAAVFVHGVTSHARFEFLNHSADPLDANRRDLFYEESWIQAMNQQGINIYSLDLQGHGLSEGWCGARCNVERFDDFAVDILDYLHIVNKTVNSRTAAGEAPTIPIFLLGISLGGAVALRTIELLESEAAARVEYRQKSFVGTFKDDLHSDETAGREDVYVPANVVDPHTAGSPPRPGPVDLEFAMKGCVLVAPMLSVETFLSKPINRLLAMIGGVASCMAPHMPAVALQANEKFPMMDADREADPLVYHGKIPARLARENLACITRLLRDAPSIGRTFSAVAPIAGEEDKLSRPSTSTVASDDIKVAAEDVRPKSVERSPAVAAPPAFLIIHSQCDTMVESEGSQKLYELLVNVPDKQLRLINTMWHVLITEPGNEFLKEEVVLWMHEHITDNFTTMRQEIQKNEGSSMLRQRSMKEAEERLTSIEPLAERQVALANNDEAALQQQANAVDEYSKSFDRSLSTSLTAKL